MKALLLLSVLAGLLFALGSSEREIKPFTWHSLAMMCEKLNPRSEIEMNLPAKEKSRVCFTDETGRNTQWSDPQFNCREFAAPRKSYKLLTSTKYVFDYVLSVSKFRLSLYLSSYWSNHVPNVDD